MATTVTRLRSTYLTLCVLELVLTSERQIFDFLGYMWTPILANFLNVLFLIFGCFGAVQSISKYLYAYVSWSVLWLGWNAFLICFFLNVGSLNRESDILSLGTGSVSWWEVNGWGCRPVWAPEGGAGAWLRPARVDGCAVPWPRVELAQAVLALLLTAAAFGPAVALAVRASTAKPSEKECVSRRPIYTIELSRADAVAETAAKPMTPRRVKRRSGTRSNNSSVRRSRRSYRNAAYLASTASLPREPRAARPASAHSSYSNYHGARPSSYHAGDAQPAGYDVTGSYDMRTFDSRPMSTLPYEPANLPPPTPDGQYTSSPYSHASFLGEASGWEAPPPPAPPYCARATPQAPGPPAYRASPDTYH